METKPLPIAPPPTPGDKSFAFVSLGCPKNLVDSERMLGKLAQAGYALTPDAAGADVVVVNTCGFIEPARQESLGVIREMLDLKRQGKVGAVVVAGCLAERLGDKLLEDVPDVDHIVGVFGREEIVDVVDRSVYRTRREEQRSLFRPAPVKALGRAVGGADRFDPASVQVPTPPPRRLRRPTTGARANGATAEAADLGGTSPDCAPRDIRSSK